MKTRTFKTRNGRELKFSAIGLGTAPMGDLYELLDEKTAIATIEQAYESGVRMFDTSPHYGNGLAESRMGAGLRRAARDEVIVSTKIGRVMDPFAKPPPTEQRRVLAGVRRRLSACAAFRLFVRRHDAFGRAILAAHGAEPARHPADPRLRRLDAWQGRSGRRFKEAMEGAYRALDKLRSEKTVAAIGFGINEADTCVKFATRRRFRRGDDGRPLLAADPERPGRIPAARARKEDGRHAGGRVQFRHPGNRRHPRRQVRVRACARRDHGSRAQDRSDLRRPRNVASGAPPFSSRWRTRRSCRWSSGR